MGNFNDIFGESIIDKDIKDSLKVTNQTSLYTNNVQAQIDSTFKANQEPTYKYTQQGFDRRGFDFGEVSEVKSEGPGFVREAGNFFGNLLGGALDTIGFGVPYLISDLTGWTGIKEVLTLGAYDPWEEETAAGKWGRGIGLAVGLINPFKWVSKGLGLLGKGAISGSKKLFTSMADDAVTGFAAKYASQKGGQQVLGAVQRIGGSATKEAVDVTSAAFKGGYRSLFDDAWKIANDKGFKGMLKGSQEMLAQGIDEMTAGIMAKVSNITRKEASELSRHLITEAVHHSHNSLTFLTNKLAKGILQTGDKALLTVPSNLAKYAGMKGGEVYASQILGAMITDFAIGSTFFASHYAIHNLVTLGHWTGTGSKPGEYGKNVEKDSEAYFNTHAAFGEAIKKLFTSGMWMSLIGPTRFIAGGTTQGGRGLKQDLYGGFNTIRKSYTPISKMSGDGARLRLQIIDDAADGLLHQSFGRLAGKQIAELSDDVAKVLLKDVRRKFSGEYSKFIVKEIGKNLYGSSPRMIAGALAMSAEGVFHQLSTNPREFHKAFGEDGREIVTNIMTGMVFSRHGRSFKTGHKSRIWQTGDIADYYAINVNDMNKMRRGLEIMGLDTSTFNLQQGSPMYESTRNHVRGTGVFKEIHELVNDFYVDRVDHNNPNIKPPKEAYTEYVENNLGYKPGTTEHKIAMNKFGIAETILNIYNETAPDVNMMFREVQGKEMFDLIESLTSLETVKNAKDIDLALNNDVLKAYNVANTDYKRIRQAFIINGFESLGITAVPDASGRIVIKDVNLDGLFKGATTVRETRGNTAVDVFQKLVKQGVTDGWIKKVGQGKVEATAEIQEGFARSYERSRQALLVHIYGAENVKNGKYPAGGIDGDLLMLINPGMREASKGIDTAVQAQNALTLLSSGKKSPSELYHTLDSGLYDRIQSGLQELKLGENPVLDLTGQDASNTKPITDFLAKLVDVHKILNSSGGNSQPTISLEQVASLRKDMMLAVGDSFENLETFKGIQSKAYHHFVKELKINESGSNNSVALATMHLLRGDRLMDQSSVLNKGPGSFVVRTNEGLVMPDGVMLLQKLIGLSPDKVEMLKKEGISEFYDFLQQTLSKSGNVVKFTKNNDDINRIIKEIGSDQIVELLVQAKAYSDAGSIKDLMYKTLPMEQAQQKILHLRETFFKDDQTQLNEVEKKFLEDLEILQKQTRGLTKMIQFAMSNRDYPTLLNINKRKLEFDTFMSELNNFLKIEVDKEGRVTTEYKQLLAKQIMNADNFLKSNYGEINLENYSKYVEEQLKLNKQNLPSKHEEMLVNITPAQFEGKYGLSADGVKGIVSTYIDNYKIHGDATQIDKAYDALYDRISKDQFKIDEADRKSAEEMTIDAFQTILTAVGTREVNKVKWIGDKFEVSKSYLVNQDNVGVYGLMKRLGVENEFYILDKSYAFADGKGGMKYTNSPSTGELTVFGSRIANSKIEIDNPTERMNLMKGLLHEDHATFYTPKEYIAVHLDESTSIVVARDVAMRAITEGFAENGAITERLNRLFKDPNDPVLVRILEKFRDNKNLTQEILEDGFLTARLLQDMPHTVREQPVKLLDVKSLWKTLKMPEFSKGRVYTPEILAFTSNFYRNKSNVIPYFKAVADVYDTFKNARGEWREMEFISYADETVDSFFSSQKRYNDWVDSQRNLYGDAYLTEVQANLVKEAHEKVAKSVVDAATYVTKEMFLFHMAQLGVRPEWIHTNSKGEIVGFRTGAIKPKGVNVQLDKDGRMVVWYDKTALFYDPKMDKLLKDKGVDGMAFGSGNKINKYRENIDGNIVDRYTSSDRLDGQSFGETIFEDMQKLSNRGGETRIKLPLSTFNVSSIAREKSGKAGANIGVHIDHNSDLAGWMGIKQRVRDFEGFLARANASDYSITALAAELMGKKVTEGDLMLSKIPIEQILQENGLITDQWMGDIAVDKLFTYFFEGAKIGTAEVGNSSISPMAPPIHMKASESDQAVRYFENIKTSEGDVSVGRQKIIGSYTPDAVHLDKQFSFNGESNTRHGGDVSNPNEGNFFVKRLKIIVDGEPVIGDFLIIPTKTKKDGTQNWSIVGMGMELRADKVIELNIQQRGANLERFNDNKAVYWEVIFDMNAAYKDIYEASRTNGITNRDVVELLSYNKHKDKGIQLGILNNRQPRNLINDVVINKISPTEIRDQYGVKKYETGTDWRGGNKSEQNFSDAIGTQDSDYDFDKSTGYFSAPHKFVTDISRKSGYGNKNDSYSFAEAFLANLTTRLDKSSTMLEHLATVNNGAMFRGRLVKLHNIATYFMNAFKDQPILANFSDNNIPYQVRMKGGAEYFMSVDNISNWTKIFIDNYKNPTDLWNIQPLIENILFGTSKERSNGNRHYEGLFELGTINRKGEYERLSPYIDNEYVDIRSILYNKMVGPISRYLRLNRGMTEEQQGQKSLKLKDLANGFSSLRYELDNPNIYLDKNGKSNKFTSGKLNFGIDIKPGMQTLSDYVVGGPQKAPSIYASQNPFDIAMRTLTSVYENSIHEKQRHKIVGDVESVMMKAEAGVLLEREGIPFDWNRTSLSNELWKYVQNDMDYIGLVKLNYRIESMEKQINVMKSSRYKDVNELEFLTSKVTELSQLRSDLELRLGSQYDYENYQKVTVKLGHKDKGTFKALGNDYVFWDPSTKKIVAVIEKGQTNKFGDLKSHWVAVVNGRRFSFTDPQVNKAQEAKLLAFGSLPMENVPSSGDITFLGSKEYGKFIHPIYTDAIEQISYLKKQYMGRLGKVDQMSGADYSTQRKAIINRALNQESVDTPLKRKALIWAFIKPQLDRNRVSYYKDSDGNHINSLSLYDNPLHKATWSLLMDIAKGESFVSNNNITSIEARNLMKEIVGRQTLATLGLKNPHLEVSIDYDFGDYNARYNRNLYLELNREDIKSSASTGPEAERALVILNDFINGERLLTPADVKKLENKFKLSDGQIFLTSEKVPGKLNPSPKRVFGKPTRESTIDFVNRIIVERKRQRDEKSCRKN